MGLISTLTPAAQVQLLYIGYFTRAADAGGDIFWNNAYASLSAQGESQTQILTTLGNDFTAQPQTLENYPFLATTSPLSASNPTEVAAVDSLLVNVYANLFSETVSASDSGLQFWANLLLNNTISLSTAILQIADGATGTGLTALQNKISAATFFTTSTAGASLGLINPTAALLTQSALAVSSVDSTAASLTASETATSDFIAAGGGGSGSTIQILASNLVYNGTTGNDTFLADNTSTGHYNLGAATTIAGGGGIDTLKVYSDGTQAALGYTPSQITGINTLWINNAEAVIVDATGFVGLKSLQLNAPGGTAGGIITTVKLNGQNFVVSNDTPTAPDTFVVNSAVDTTENITVSSVAVTGGAALFDIAGGQVTSATLTGSGSATSHVTIDNAVGGALATLNIGDGPALAVNFDLTDTALKTVDAAADTGTLNVDLSAIPVIPATFAFTGGSGATTLTVTQLQLDTLTAGSQLNGGTATSGNTLDITGAAGALAAHDYAEINGTTGFQTLGFSNVGAGATVDVSQVTAYTNFAYSDSAAGNLLTFDNLAATGDTVSILAGGVGGLSLDGHAAGAVVTLDLGNASSIGISNAGAAEQVTLGVNIGGVDLVSNGSASSTGNFVSFTENAAATASSYTITGGTNLEIASVGNVIATTVVATAFTGNLEIGTGTPGGGLLAPGTSGFNDTYSLGSGASIVVEQTNESAGANKFDTITLAPTHAASTIAYAGVGVAFASGANLELVKSGFDLGQDSVAISGAPNTYSAGDVTGTGFTISSSGLVTAGASNLASFEAGLVAGAATHKGDTIVYTDSTNTYVAEATAVAAGDWHVIELAGVVATHGVSISHGLAIISGCRKARPLELPGGVHALVEKTVGAWPWGPAPAVLKTTRRSRRKRVWTTGGNGTSLRLTTSGRSF
ncbi:beta strand repeat-containing protein [Rhodoblastus sp.]|uniref:beta strand repeat-containing protein n=1 Tax=Rhodoblastus sp. TaxID=1962975 RepID=UPI003F98FEDB